MKTLGIDLASDPQKTGVALVEWWPGRAAVALAEVGADDERLRALHAAADATGIDAPFGWPADFVAFVERHGTPAGAGAAAWTTGHRDRLRFRETDRAVRRVTGRWPLSVSSDLIAVPTFRCLGLLAAIGVLDRGGDGRVFETYPAVALARWGLTSLGYKGPAKRARLSALVDGLRAAAPWLVIPPAIEARLRVSDDAFDAVVAALVARAARLAHDGRPGLVEAPTAAQRARAQSEGWIVLPTADGLARLVDPVGGPPGEVLFETARLRVRRITPDDFDVMYATYSDPIAMRWVDDGSPITADDCRRWLDVTRRNDETRGYGMSAVCLAETGEVVGFCGLVHPDGQPEPELKYALRRQFWGRGLATEVAVGMLAWGARRHGMRWIIATVAEPHRVSQRVLEKAGMVRVEVRAEAEGPPTVVYGWRPGSER